MSTCRAHLAAGRSRRRTDFPPVDLTTNRFEMRYGPDWQPIELKLDATLRGAPIGLVTSFGVTTAISEITQSGQTTQKTDEIAAKLSSCQNNHFGAYEALAARLGSAKTGDELRVHAPQAEIPVRIGDISAESIPHAGSGRGGSPLSARVPESQGRTRGHDLGRRSFAARPIRNPVRVAASRPGGAGVGRGAPRDHESSRRRARVDPGRRVYACGDGHPAARSRCRGAPKLPAVVLGRLRADRPRPGRRGDPNLRTACRRPRRCRLHRHALRQARCWSSGGRLESATLADFAEDGGRS